MVYNFRWGGRRQEDPWGLLTSQCSQSVSSYFNKRPSLKRSGGGDSQSPIFQIPGNLILSSVPPQAPGHHRVDPSPLEKRLGFLRVEPSRQSCDLSLHHHLPRTLARKMSLSLKGLWDLSSLVSSLLIALCLHCPLASAEAQHLCCSLCCWLYVGQ